MFSSINVVNITINLLKSIMKNIRTSGIVPARNGPLTQVNESKSVGDGLSVIPINCPGADCSLTGVELSSEFGKTDLVWMVRLFRD